MGGCKVNVLRTAYRRSECVPAHGEEHRALQGFGCIRLEQFVGRRRLFCRGREEVQEELQNVGEVSR